jgi:hypothetical protein
MWTLIGLAGAFLSTTYAVWALYLGTGMIFYVGLIDPHTGSLFLMDGISTALSVC